MYEYYDGIYHNNKKSATNTNVFVLFYTLFILLYCSIYRHVFYVRERGEKRAAEAPSTTIYHGKQFFSFVVLLYCRLVHCDIVFYSMHSPFFFRCVPTQNMNSIRNDNRLFLWSTPNILQYIRRLLACLRYGGHIRQKQIVSKAVKNARSRSYPHEVWSWVNRIWKYFERAFLPHIFTYFRFFRFSFCNCTYTSYSHNFAMRQWKAYRLVTSAPSSVWIFTNKEQTLPIQMRRGSVTGKNRNGTKTERVGCTKIDERYSLLAMWCAN